MTVRAVGAALAGVLIAVSAMAAPKARKLTADAYIKTVKIEVSALDTTRFAYAEAMLDSLFLYYGPYAEGYYWIARMKLHMNEKTGDLKKKRAYLTSAVAYMDSLRIVCADKGAKMNNRKGCDKFVAEFDTIKTQLWRTYYTDGFRQIGMVQQQIDGLKSETDSTAIAEARKIISQNTDSCLDNMGLAIIVDPKDSRAYIGVANAYEKQDSLDRSTEWLMKGLERATTPEERLPLVQQLAISLGGANRFCEAVKYFREWVDLVPKDTSAVPTMTNLAICYSGCNQYDSALLVYREVLTIRPGDLGALAGIGKHFRQMAGSAGDSSTAYEALKNEPKAKQWRDTRKQRFDSAKVYMKQVFDGGPEDAAIAEEYGLVCYLVEDYENAATAFIRVTRLDATNFGAWTTLGDCNVLLRKWTDAITAYEHAIAGEPDNKAVLQQLSSLYHQEGMTAKAAEIDARLNKK